MDWLAADDRLLVCQQTDRLTTWLAALLIAQLTNERTDWLTDGIMHRWMGHQEDVNQSNFNPQICLIIFSHPSPSSHTQHPLPPKRNNQKTSRTCKLPNKKKNSFLGQKNSSIPSHIFEHPCGIYIYLSYFLAEFEQSFLLSMMMVKDSWCAPVQDPENWDQGHKKQNREKSGRLPKVQVTGRILIPASYKTAHIRMKILVT